MRLALFLTIALLCQGVAVTGFAASTRSADEWLEIASNPQQSSRRRNYAAGQILVLADASASTLFSALRDADRSLKRQVAARLLGRLEPSGAEAALLTAAFGEDFFLASAAKQALTEIYSHWDDQHLHALLRQGRRENLTQPGTLPTGDDWLALTMAESKAKSQFRAVVMQGIARKYGAGLSPMPEALAALVWDSLLDADTDLRLAAVQAAAVSRSPEAPEKLAAFLYSENNTKLLVEALRAMAAMRPPDHGAAVERQAAHSEPMVALEALAAMAAMGYQGVMFAAPGERTVAAFVQHPSTPVRLRAIEILAATRNPAALEPLMAGLHDRVGPNRAAAAKALGELGFTGAAGDISPLRRDDRADVRTEAAVALHRLGVVGVTSGCVDDLSAETPLPHRQAAARALGRMGDKRAVKHLIPLLRDEDEELACLAADALGALQDKQAGPPLFETLRGTDNIFLADAVRSALATLYRDDPGDVASGWETWAVRNGLKQ